MADIELVIKIPEGLKKDFELEQWTALSCMEMKRALMNGTQIPKGHGRLIDADRLKDNYKYHYALFLEAYGSTMNMPKDIKSRCDELDNAIADIINAPTIIEADRRIK